ncbi:MAG TPA: hypothetical protein VNH11_10300 [Pirellulales bacterium]|nr:hypothetical protein [Pirellulales bacterium]
MNFYLWTDEIIAHLPEHDVTPEDFEFVLDHEANQSNTIND